MKTSRLLRSCALVLLASAGVACLDDSITGARPLTFSLTVPEPTAQVGDSVTFEYEATGTGILGVIMNYGDGTVDSMDVVSASGGGNIVEYSDAPRYAYETSGTYEVIGRLETTDGSASDTVQVEITP